MPMSGLFHFLDLYLIDCQTILGQAIYTQVQLADISYKIKLFINSGLYLLTPNTDDLGTSDKQLYWKLAVKGLTYI